MSRVAWPKGLESRVRDGIVRRLGATTSRTGWAQRLAIAALVVLVIAVGARTENRRATAEVGIIDGNTWLTSRSTQEVVLVNSATGEVTARTDVSESDAESTQPIISRTVGNDAVILRTDSGTISLISGATLQPIATASLPGAVGADQLLAAGDLVHVVHSANANGFTLDRTNLFVVGSFEFPTGSTAAVTPAGDLWVASPRLSGVEGSAGNVRVSGREAASTFLIGKDGESPGLTTLGNDGVVLDRSGGTLTFPASGRNVEVCRSGLNLNRVMVVAVADLVNDTRMVVLIDPLTGQITGTNLDDGLCVDLEDIGTGPWGRPVSNGRYLYVAQSIEGVVAAIDTTTSDVRIIQSIAPNGDLDLVADDGAVWFNDLAGPDVGVFSGLEIAMRARKYPRSAEGVQNGDARPSLLNDAGKGDQRQDIDEAAEVERLDGGAVRPDVAGATPTGFDNDFPGGSAAAGREDEPSAAGGSGTAVSLEPAAKAAAPDTTQATATAQAVTAVTGESTSIVSTTGDVVAPSSSVTSPSVTSTPEINRPAVTTAEIGPAPADALQPVPNSTADGADTEATGPATPVDELKTTFTYEPDTNVAVGEEIIFKATAASAGSDADDADYSWDFGDGTAAIGRNIAHTWAQPGEFLVTLTAQIGTQSAVESQWFTVYRRDTGRPPSADFEYSAVEESPGGRIEFSDTSTGEPTEWLWDFGDGTTGIGQEVSHTWSTPARYLVTLTVTNEFGSDSTSVQVIIGEPIPQPEALILAVPDTVAVGETIMFRAVGANNRTTKISWDFGDGNRGQGLDIDHVYSSTGSKRVVLTLVNPSGRSQDVIDVLVTPRPSATTSTAAPLPTAETVPTTAASTTASTVIARPADEGTTTEPSDEADLGSTTEQSITEQPTATAEPTTTTAQPATTTSTTQPTTTTTRPTTTTTTRPTTTTTRPTTTTTRPTTTTTRPTTTTTRPTTTTTRPTTTTTRPTTTSTQPTTTTTQPTTTTRPSTTAGQVKSDAIGRVAGNGTVEVGELVTFESSSTGPFEWLVWTFGDGSESRDRNPTHRYTEPGVYWASVTVGSGSDAADSDPVRVEVVPATSNDDSDTSPLAIRPNPARVGQAVEFVNESNGDVVVTKWLVDGQELRATGSNSVWHSFNSPGTRTVRMELCEAGNVSNCWFVTDDVEVLADPNASGDVTRQSDANGVTISWKMDGGSDATTIVAGNAVTFTDLSDPRPLALEWEIGGRSSTDRSTTLTFDQAGDVPFRLTVVTNDGRTAVMDRTLRVVGVDGPSARIEAPIVAQVGETVYFADVSAGSPKGRTWNFGDRTSDSYDQRPQHVFGSAGVYTVTLTVWNDFGESTTSLEIEIYE